MGYVDFFKPEGYTLPPLPPKRGKIIPKIEIFGTVHQQNLIFEVVKPKGAPARESRTGGRLVSPRISLEKNF